MQIAPALYNGWEVGNKSLKTNKNSIVYFQQ